LVPRALRPAGLTPKLRGRSGHDRSSLHLAMAVRHLACPGGPMTNVAKLEAEATGPLKGVRILDMTSVVFGAYATQMLGDLGCDVIKVEFPGGRRGGGGDIMRWTGALPEGCPPDLGPIYMTINRNKRSVLLDLRDEKAARQL